MTDAVFARSALKVIHDEHRALEAMLRTMPLLVAHRRQRAMPANFTLLRAMLCYIAEYPERLHHPKEDGLLFPALRAARPDLAGVLDRLADEHDQGARRLEQLERALTAYECLGDRRAGRFCELLDEYVQFYLSHMQLEEREVLPAARSALLPGQWRAIAEAFALNRDPLAGPVPEAQEFRALRESILDALPAPLGYGSSN